MGSEDQVSLQEFASNQQMIRSREYGVEIIGDVVNSKQKRGLIVNGECK